MLSYKMRDYGRGEMTVTDEVPLNVLSFGLGQLFAWALGCGVHRLELTLSKTKNGSVSIYMEPLNEPQTIQAANCSTMRQLNEWNLLPTKIPVPEQLTLTGEMRSLAWDGQARVIFDKDIGMLIETYDVRPEIDIAKWGFAHSDHITGFFLRGVTKVKIFHSMQLTQIFLSPAPSEGEVRRMMTDTEDYPQNVCVSKIK